MIAVSPRAYILINLLLFPVQLPMAVGTKDLALGYLSQNPLLTPTILDYLRNGDLLVSQVMEVKNAGMFFAALLASQV